MTNLLVFPGQGSQFVGMGKAFADNFAASRDVYEEVNESLGQDLTKIISFSGARKPICWNGKGIC